MQDSAWAAWMVVVAAHDLPLDEAVAPKLVLSGMLSAVADNRNP